MLTQYQCINMVIESNFVFITFFLGRAGVPMEVMGLMLGEFVDDYTVRVIDVFAMPQSGTVSVLLVIVETNQMIIVKTNYL